MPKFIEPMATENVTEIRNWSMYITKAFEIRKMTYEQNLRLPLKLSWI